MRDLKLIVLIAAAFAALTACGAPAANNTANAVGNKPTITNDNAAPPATSPSSAATGQLDGKAMYTESCQICHKDTGKGGPTTVDGKKIKPADLTSARQKKHPDDDIAKDISEGSPEDGMPAFKDKLKPEEIKAIVAYIRTLQQQ
jgi:mono/diheme cytochrome c family protein